MTFVRPATLADVRALTSLLNTIIAVGGTTAHQTPYTPGDFAEHYLTGAHAIACHVAQAGQMTVGFQVLGVEDGLPEGWSDIGTFVAETARGTGAGAALFRATKAVAQRRGFSTINATIRSDNVLGLRYYDNLGFRDYAQHPEWCLDDGTRVGRVSKRFDL